MSVTVERKALAKAMKDLNVIAARVSTLPVLTQVSAQVCEGHLELVATDLEMRLTCLVPLVLCDDHQFKAAFPAYQFGRAASAADSEHVTIEVDAAARVHAKFGHADLILPGCGFFEDFPTTLTSPLAGPGWPVAHLAAADLAGILAKSW